MCGTTSGGTYTVIDVIAVPEHNNTGEPGGPFWDPKYTGAKVNDNPYVKAIAADYKVPDIDQDTGDPIQRPATTAARLPSPFPNEVAARASVEVVEKWAGRMIPLISSALGAGLNYWFVRAWGERAKAHFRERHMQLRQRAMQPTAQSILLPAAPEVLPPAR